MLGSTALLSRGQLDRLNKLVADYEVRHTVIGIVIDNPRPRAVTVSLINEDGDAFIEETFLGFEEDDPALVHPALADVA